MSWADVAREVFDLVGADRSRVQASTTSEYYANAERAIAPRPRNSTLDLSKIESTGFVPSDGLSALREYIST